MWRLFSFPDIDQEIKPLRCHALFLGSVFYSVTRPLNFIVSSWFEVDHNKITDQIIFTISEGEFNSPSHSLLNEYSFIHVLRMYCIDRGGVPKSSDACILLSHGDIT